MPAPTPACFVECWADGEGFRKHRYLQQLFGYCRVPDQPAGQTFRDFEIHVLDNASADATVELVRRFNVEIVTSSFNTGFSKGHNTLIRSSHSDYVLALNPDAVLRPDFIGELVAALEDTATGCRFGERKAAANG